MFTKKNLAGFGMLFLVPFLSFIYFLAVLSRGSTSDTINWFMTKFIIFSRFSGISSRVYQPTYLPDIYGTLGIGLAVIGILYLFYVRKKWGNSGLLAVAALTGIINLILFHFPHIGSFILEGFAFIFGIFGINLVFNLPEYFTVFIFYERLIYYTMIFLAPLSAIGLYAAAKSVASIGILNRIHKYAGIFLCMILIATALTLTFSGYYEEKEKLYKMITDEDYDAIKWIEENKGTGHVILARTEVSMTIYSISRNYIVAGTSHEDNCLGGNVNDVHRFFMGDCSERLGILKKHNVSYVITDFEISCGLKEIYRNKKDYVYEAV